MDLMDLIDRYIDIMEFWESEKDRTRPKYTYLRYDFFHKEGSKFFTCYVPTYLLGTLGVWSTMAKPATPPHASWRNQLRRPTVL